MTPSKRLMASTAAIFSSRYYNIFMILTQIYLIVFMSDICGIHENWKRNKRDVRILNI